MSENKTTPTDESVNKVDCEDTGSEESSIYPPPYYADSSGLYVEMISKTGATMKKLCNFLPAFSIFRFKRVYSFFKLFI